MFTSPRITSTTLTSSARARSPTTIVFGRLTTVEVSATATGATGSGTGWGMGARCGRRPLGRGPRCGGIRLGLALGTRSPFFRRRRELASQPVGRHSVDINFERSGQYALREPALEASRIGIEIGPASGRLPAKVYGELPRR